MAKSEKKQKVKMQKMIKLKNLLNEVSYEKSGLKKPELADRDKDKKISSWEKKVGQKIEKNLDETAPQDEYSIGMKKYSVGRPQQYPDSCQECGGMVYEGSCMECDSVNQNQMTSYDGGYEHEEESHDHEVGMAQNLLKDIISNASQLMDKIGQEEINLPGWIQDHISKAQNYISQANVGYHEL